MADERKEKGFRVVDRRGEDGPVKPIEFRPKGKRSHSSPQSAGRPDPNSASEKVKYILETIASDTVKKALRASVYPALAKLASGSDYAQALVLSLARVLILKDIISADELMESLQLFGTLKDYSDDNVDKFLRGQVVPLREVKNDNPQQDGSPEPQCDAGQGEEGLRCAGGQCDDPGDAARTPEADVPAVQADSSGDVPGQA